MATSKTGTPQEGLHIPLRLRHSRDSTQTGGRWQGGPGDDGVVVLVVWGASLPSVKSVRRGVSDRRAGVKAALTPPSPYARRHTHPSKHHVGAHQFATLRILTILRTPGPSHPQCSYIFLSH
ncbi:hypothetical protein Pcinc_028180 [Petrolisthes cinctipes]|uniref:Uncharacterized protein n=1 Tax=Petrolisthes cinctipes TaxID=88211 RepID=A0AAE1K9A4_PETCI|nr:hypothetical protein Pcinc_028180 [Petrolisthes cinctipes]